MAGAASSPAPARRRWIALLLALPLGALAAEGLVRVIGLEAMPLTHTVGATIRKVDDPALGFANRVGASMRLEYRERAGDPPRVVVMNVNQQGFRGPKVKRAKPSDVLRIACIGDSHTFGYGVADDETWPARLQVALGKKNADGRRIQVLNCGVSAHDTPQEVRWLETKVMGFNPDIVLLQYYVNDAAIRGLADPGDPDPLVALTHPRREGALRTMRDVSRLFDVACDRVYRYQSLRVYAAERRAHYTEGNPGWTAVREALRRAHELTTLEDVAFGVVLFPFLVRGDDFLTSHDSFEIVKEFLARERIPFTDPEPAFLEVDVDGMRVSDMDYHANGAGYDLFAGEVADWVRQRGLVDPSTARDQ